VALNHWWNTLFRAANNLHSTAKCKLTCTLNHSDGVAMGFSHARSKHGFACFEYVIIFDITRDCRRSDQCIDICQTVFSAFSTDTFNNRHVAHQFPQWCFTGVFDACQEWWKACFSTMSNFTTCTLSQTNYTHKSFSCGMSSSLTFAESFQTFWNTFNFCNFSSDILACHIHHFIVTDIFFLAFSTDAFNNGHKAHQFLHRCWTSIFYACQKWRETL